MNIRRIFVLSESEDLSLLEIVVITVFASLILFIACIFAFFLFEEEIKDPLMFLILLSVTLLAQTIPVKYFYDNYGLLKENENEPEDKDEKET